MAVPGYMWITDDQGLPVEGNSKVLGRKGSIEVLGFDHRIYIPNDTDTGALTGTRKHEPFVVRKSFCSASPLLYKSCCSGSTLNEIRLSWYQISNQGQEEEYFRHVLTNAKVVCVHPLMEDIKDKSKEAYGHLEKIAFRYEKIEWTYLDGNISTSDQWSHKY